MSLFDLVLLIIIGGFGLFGFWFGLIHTLGSLVGTVAGVFLASRYYEPLAAWLTTITGWGGNFPRVLTFIIAFILINRLVGLAFWIIDQLLSIVTRLPFVNSLNRMLGLIFGFFEGTLVLGMVFFFIVRFPVGPQFMAWLAASKVAPYTVGAAALLWPLLPAALKLLKSSVQGIF